MIHLKRLPNVPNAIAGSVAGMSVAVVVGNGGAATVVAATGAELLTIEECRAAAQMLNEAADCLEALQSHEPTTIFEGLI